jgi:hypothetical protein
MTTQVTKKGNEGSKARLINVLHVWGNYSKSEEVARRHGGRLPTLSELIIDLGNHPDMYTELSGKSLWVGDSQGIKSVRTCVIDYKNGKLNPLFDNHWEELPIERRAILFNGNGPIIVYISNGKTARLQIDADLSSDDDASIVTFVAEKQAEQKPRNFIRKLVDLLRQE